VQALASLAHEDGCCVCCVIHQPSAAVFSQFDDLLLLGEHGRVCYFGPTADLPRALQAKGYPCPRGTSPAEWALQASFVLTPLPKTTLPSSSFLFSYSPSASFFLIQLVSVDSETPETKRASLERLEALSAPYLKPTVPCVAPAALWAQSAATSAASAVPVWLSSGTVAAKRAPFFVRSLVQHACTLWIATRR
jgi:hypothetical protein